MEKVTSILLTEALDNMRENGSSVIVGGTHTLKRANNGKTSNVYFFSTDSTALDTFKKKSDLNFYAAKLDNEQGTSNEDKVQSKFSQFANLSNKDVENFEEACNCKHALYMCTPEINEVTKKPSTKRAYTILASDDIESLMSHISGQVDQIALVNNSSKLQQKNN